MNRKILTIIISFFFSSNIWAAACNNAQFLNFYKVVQHPNSGNPNYVRYDKTPNNYTGFNEHCYANSTWPGTCFETYGKRYKLVVTSGLTTKWSAAVCGKARQADNWFNYEHRIFLVGQSPFYAGPKLSFQVKGDDGKWRILKSSSTGNLASFEFDPNTTENFRWQVTSSKPQQFRMVVERAMKFDEFDLIMDW